MGQTSSYQSPGINDEGIQMLKSRQIKNQSEQQVSDLHSTANLND